MNAGTYKTFILFAIIYAQNVFYFEISKLCKNPKMATTENPKVYFEIAIGTRKVEGRIEIELRADVVPRTAGLLNIHII